MKSTEEAAVFAVNKGKTIPQNCSIQNLTAFVLTQPGSVAWVSGDFHDWPMILRSHQLFLSFTFPSKYYVLSAMLEFLVQVSKIAYCH